MKRIICATDFSADARSAAEAAVQWTSELGAELHVVHSVDPAPLAVGTMLPDSLMPTVGIREGMLDHAARELDAVGRELGIECEFVLLEHASASIAVCDYAGKVGADLVVVGSRGRTGVEHMLIGSVAEQVLRLSPCPVLCVRGSGRLPSSLIACTDFSPAAEPGLDLAAEVARAFEAEATVLNVQEESVWRSATSYADDTTMRSIDADLRKRLARYHSERFAPPIKSVLLVRAGVPQAIVGYAREQAADLVVLSTHGRTGVGRFIIGSVAERVARHATCSVLVARSKPCEFLTGIV